MRKAFIVSIGLTIAGTAFMMAIILAKLDVNVLWVYGCGLVSLIGFGISMSTKESIIKKRIETEQINRSSQMVLNHLPNERK